MKNKITIPEGVIKTFHEKTNFKKAEILMAKTAVLPFATIQHAKNLKYLCDTPNEVIDVPDGYFPNDDGEAYCKIERLITADELCLQGDVTGALTLEYSD